MSLYQPGYELERFYCPFCHVFAYQFWATSLVGSFKSNHVIGSRARENLNLLEFSSSRCSSCLKFSIWKDGSRMIYPLVGNVETPNPDMPEEVLTLYNEAKDVISISPKSAAALMRLAIQKLCAHIGGNGKHINDDIKNMVKEGLPIKIQQALDILRVVGNNAVHPGEIKFDENPDLPYKLFPLANLICDYMITQPKEISDLYESLPEIDKQNIKKRDS